MCIITLSNCGIFIKFAYDFKIIRGFFSRIFEYKKKKEGGGEIGKKKPFYEMSCNILLRYWIGTLRAFFTDKLFRIFPTFNIIS